VLAYILYCELSQADAELWVEPRHSKLASCPINSAALLANP